MQNAVFFHDAAHISLLCLTCTCYDLYFLKITSIVLILRAQRQEVIYSRNSNTVQDGRIFIVSEGINHIFNLFAC